MSDSSFCPFFSFSSCQTEKMKLNHYKSWRVNCKKLITPKIISVSVWWGLTRRDSWKDEAWYWAYLEIVVWDRLLSKRHIFLLPVKSQFSSVGWNNWVLTSTRWSGLASTRVLVENRPKSDRAARKEEKQRTKQHNLEQKFIFQNTRFETNAQPNMLINTIRLTGNSFFF